VPPKHFELSKRIGDVMIACIAIALLCPILVITAIAIKWDNPGPVIFRQRRIGLDGRPFVIYKFRTMSVAEDGAEITQARRGDPRVTQVGRMLRQSSIDELPQLLNVIKGDMSIVGPRPHAIAHDQLYSAAIPNYARRHRVKPGITGWAQVNGLRGETATIAEMERRVVLDLWYIDNRSVLLDLRIAWRTCIELSRGQAY
jgi:undecaprenyl-phosphate galactose phosphotransferase/putative colanic acid biosynthesis UDP-glucose lipid carrier transferase